MADFSDSSQTQPESRPKIAEKSRVCRREPLHRKVLKINFHFCETQTGFPEIAPCKALQWKAARPPPQTSDHFFFGKRSFFPSPKPHPRDATSFGLRGGATPPLAPLPQRREEEFARSKSAETERRPICSRIPRAADWLSPTSPSELNPTESWDRHTRGGGHPSPGPLPGDDERIASL